jgi:hypothetical protein
MVRGVRLAALLLLGGLTAGAQGDPPNPMPGPARGQGPLVELAWLESPITFPCPLAARVTTAGLEVHGAVPNGTIREFALAIARRHTRLPVRDRLTIDPGVTGWPECPADPRALAERATTALTRALGKSADHYRVKTTMRGDVILEGQVRSLEEKVRVGKCMRGLLGCRRVRNRLAVVAARVAAPAERLSGKPLAPRGARGSVRKAPHPPGGIRVGVRGASRPPASLTTAREEKVSPPPKSPAPRRQEVRARPRPIPTDFARSRPAPVALIGAESRPAKKSPAERKPTITLRPPAQARQPAVAKRETVRIPRVRIEAPRRTRAVPTSPTRRPADLIRLRQRVASVCGPWARDVQVRQDDEGQIHVVVYVYNEGTLGTLRGWINKLPDVRQPTVSLEMKLAR